ncbi:sigma factor-like helix-turn-helix DNA-binding protein [Chitinophaga sp.]|uniref:RNA polymerase sigma factor n=1 Tax=Chitinophaga sp. TaxID=1869181 RepID=UPI0031D768E0
MHLLLNNLNDKELLLRIRKLQDREAAGVLLDRYSHLLVATSLPRLGPENAAEEAFPALVRQLFTRLQSSYGKVSDTIYEMVQYYFHKGNKNPLPYPPSSPTAIQRLENRVDLAGNNPIEKDTIASRLEEGLNTLQPEERQLVTRFYLEHQSLQELARAQHTTTDKIRNHLRQIRKKLATHLMDQRL